MKIQRGVIAALENRSFSLAEREKHTHFTCIEESEQPGLE